MHDYTAPLRYSPLSRSFYTGKVTDFPDAEGRYKIFVVLSAVSAEQMRWGQRTLQRVATVRC